MKRWLALAFGAGFFGCGGGPTAPTPDFVGNYAFVVEASTVCDLPVERFSWDLVATIAGGGANGNSYRLTLPGGDPTLSLNLAYQQGGGRRGGGSQNATTLTVALNAQAVPIGQDMQVTISGSSRGTASEGPGGRGQILDGSINGIVRLTERGPRGRTEAGSCAAGDHKFTLTPQ